MTYQQYISFQNGTLQTCKSSGKRLVSEWSPLGHEHPAVHAFASQIENTNQ
jgi:hypothetical protein